MRLTLDDWPVSRVSWQVLTKIWWSWLLTVAVLEYVWHPRLKTRKWKVYIWRLDSFEPAICHLATYCSTVVSFLYLCTVSDYQYVSVSCSTYIAFSAHLIFWHVSHAHWLFLRSHWVAGGGHPVQHGTHNVMLIWQSQCSHFIRQMKPTSCELMPLCDS